MCCAVHFEVWSEKWRKKLSSPPSRCKEDTRGKEWNWQNVWKRSNVEIAWRQYFARQRHFQGAELTQIDSENFFIIIQDFLNNAFYWQYLCTSFLLSASTLALSIPPSLLCLVIKFHLLLRRAFSFPSFPRHVLLLLCFFTFFLNPLFNGLFLSAPYFYLLFHFLFSSFL
jgi:hypothetical protein